VARYGVDVEASLNILAHVLRADVDASRVAAIVLEPVQGEGGFHLAPPELMAALRTLCDAHGILLIADEVQTGFARTGRLFAMEHYISKPDIMIMAKSLAGGFPLSAVTGRKDVMDKVEPGGLGGTYGGSPIGCAAALAVLDVIEEEYLIPRAVKLGERALARLDEMSKRNDLYPIDAVRGLGSMVAFDIVATRGGREGDGSAVKKITAKALEEGLLILGCGVFGETLRLLYPLTIPDAQFDEGMNRLERALKV
jgi:4-aminobutyrate aminotransferase/(S)-3-amino-2-methylpropionate transaminase